MRPRHWSSSDAHPSRNFLRAFVLQPRKQESPPSYQIHQQSHPPSRTILTSATPTPPPPRDNKTRVYLIGNIHSQNGGRQQPHQRLQGSLPPVESLEDCPRDGSGQGTPSLSRSINAPSPTIFRLYLTCLCLDYRVTSWRKTKSRSPLNASRLNTRTRMEHQSEFTCVITTFTFHGASHHKHQPLT